MTRPLISADSHVTEPLDLWQKRLDARFREHAPRQEVRDGRMFLSMGGRVVFSLPREEAESGRESHGGADLTARLRDMEVDGVVGEIIYPTIGLFIYAITDRELALACARVYNDWAAEIFLGRGDVFQPIALIPIVDVGDATSELERCASMGFRTVAPPLHSPPDRPYTDPAYEPLWRAAEQAGSPLSVHVGTGTQPHSHRGAGGAIVNYLRVGMGAPDALAFFAAGGIFMNHPKLHVVIAEAGAGWLAYLMERSDEAFEEHAHWVNPKLDAPPSEYLRRQCSVTFGHERAPLLTLEVTTAQPLMWASDYPHPEGTWPDSQRKAEESLKGLAEDEIERIVCGNARRVYGFAG